ncbi:MAG TPA: crossover junction endodeoxyribonuclease RuvC [Candidatus Binataceae bacterium]|jgi:crossover junction endodeoxyribonuclease RuvC
MRVLGIDPGSAVTGFGVVDRDHGISRLVAAGVIRARRGAGRAQRLLNIHSHLCDLIREHCPDSISLERSFVAENVQSAFRLGEARAIALLAAAQNRLSLFEYAPAEVKLTVTGYGRADKAQVKFVVRRSLNLAETEAIADDASDAIAIALCHLAAFRYQPRLAAQKEERRR